MIVPSIIEPFEVLPQDGSRLGRYVEVRQGSQSLSVEVGAVGDLIAALCEASGLGVVALELGTRRLLVPGALGLPPGEYGALIVIE